LTYRNIYKNPAVFSAGLLGIVMKIIRLQNLKHIGLLNNTMGAKERGNIQLG
jgi:hypothetical protein